MCIRDRPTVGIAVIGALIAVIYYQFFSKTEVEGRNV